MIGKCADAFDAMRGGLATVRHENKSLQKQKASFLLHYKPRFAEVGDLDLKPHLIYEFHLRNV